MRGRAELALFGMTVVWGVTFVVIKGVLADISPLLFIAARFAVAALVLGAIYGRKVQRTGLKGGVLAGTLLFLAFVFQTEGLALTTPAKSAFLTGLSIPMIPLVNSLVYKTKPARYEVIGILVASFGMAFMALPTGKFAITGGDFLSLLCAIVFALHFVVLAHYSRTEGFETLAVVQVSVAAVLGIASAIGFGAVRFHPSAGLGVAVVVIGVLATALGFTALAWAQQYTTTTRAALILALEPAAAWFTSWLVTGEILSNRGKIGAGLILAGVLIVELKRGKPEILHI